MGNNVQNGQQNTTHVKTHVLAHHVTTKTFSLKLLTTS